MDNSAGSHSSCLLENGSAEEAWNGFSKSVAGALKWQAHRDPDPFQKECKAQENGSPASYTRHEALSASNCTCQVARFLQDKLFAASYAMKTCGKSLRRFVVSQHNSELSSLKQCSLYHKSNGRQDVKVSSVFAKSRGAATDRQS
jgi:hypothetical protein